MRKSPESILIIRPSALGDVCKTAPVLVSLRRGFPEARIDWLVQDSFRDAIAHHPDLDETVDFPRRKFSLWWRPDVLLEMVRWLRSLRARRYTLVVDCQGLARSGLFAWFTGAPTRIGYANAEELGWLGLNERVPVGREMHTIDRMLALAHAAGVEPIADLRLHPPPDDVARIASDDRFQGRYALLAPTSRWPGKRWPDDRFAEVAVRLLNDESLRLDRVAFIGGPSERDQCAALAELAASDPRVIDLVGETSIGGMMALIDRAAVVIANDSAALHIAVGLGRPLVGLFGPTRLDLVGPYGRGDAAIQHVGPSDRLDYKDASVGRRLMERITVDEVLGVARDQIGARPREPVSAFNRS